MKIKLTLITILSMGLIGCAPMPKVQSPQVKVTLKEIPTLTTAEKLLLQNNGFSPGVWSKDCKDKNSYAMRNYPDGEKYMFESSENGKVFSKGQFYEVKLVSNQVIQFKTQVISSDDNLQAISLYKTGYISGRRLTFDMNVLYLNGPNAGKEVIVAKDGFEMKRQQDNSYQKGKAVTPFYKCN
jgi:hypothetical protein